MPDSLMSAYVANLTLSPFCHDLIGVLLPVSAYYYYYVSTHYHYHMCPHTTAICVLTLLCMLTGVTQAQVNAAPEFLIYVSAYYCYIRVLTCVLTLLHMLPGITQAQVDAAPEFPEAVRMLTEWLAAQGFPSVSSPETSDETRVSAQDKSRVSVYADVC
jgi:hypothetical protein